MGTSGGPPFPFDVVAELTGDRGRVRRYLEEYFHPHPQPHDGYSGRFFEQFIARSNPYRFTPFDLVAVAPRSSVTIPPAVASIILLDPTMSTSLNSLLAQAPPPGTDLADTDAADLADTAPLPRLYRLLRGLPGMGPTKTSKLMAAKRPGVVPIRDNVVSTLLQAGERWWDPMRELAQEQRLRDLLDAASVDTVPAGVTFLRRLDVVLWRWGSDVGIKPSPDDAING